MATSANDVAFITVSADPIGTDDDATLSHASVAQVVGPNEVLHSDVIELIDKTERGRVLLHSHVSPETLATDKGVLVRER